MNRRPAIVLSGSLAVAFTAAAALAAAGGQSVHQADAKVVPVRVAAPAPAASHLRHVRVAASPPRSGGTTVSGTGSGPGGPAVGSAAPPSATQPAEQRGPTTTTAELPPTTEPGEGQGTTTTTVMTTTTRPSPTTTEPGDDGGPTTTEPGEGHDG